MSPKPTKLPYLPLLQITQLSTSPTYAILVVVSLIRVDDRQTVVNRIVNSVVILIFVPVTRITQQVVVFVKLLKKNNNKIYTSNSYC